MDSMISRQTQPDNATEGSGRGVPIGYLVECVTYTRESGLFVWRARPARHFDTVRAFDLWAREYAGAPAFAVLGGNGYLHGNLRCEGRRYDLLAHRVAWALHTGEWPTAEVDHIDRDRLNNRIANLRLSTRSSNAFNRKFETNSTGYVGVSRSGSRFSALIRVGADRKKRYLGTFDTAKDAHAAYVRAAKELHGEHADWL